MRNDPVAAAEPTIADARLMLMEAIIHQRLVSARYNNSTITFAPHQLFERNGDLFVSALNLSKAWRSADDHRLGQFKLVGLSVVELLQEAFEPLVNYQAATPRVDDVLVLSI
jgi:hypothetical protein